MENTLKVAYSIIHSYEDSLDIALKAGNMGYRNYIEVEGLFGNLIVLIWKKSTIDFEIAEGYFNRLEKIFSSEIEDRILNIDGDLRIEFIEEIK